MDFIKLPQFQNIAWCKPNWSHLSTSEETNKLLKQCTDLPTLEVTNDVKDIINRSEGFPIAFPIETVRLKTLQSQRPLEQLKKNISSTYPLIHERVLTLMTRFLNYKREFGSSIEKTFYKDMTIDQFIDRILKKRAIVFMKSNDTYKLITGEEGSNGWESVGTKDETPPLLLKDCLSYDEMKISAMVFVSGWTACVNDGGRDNWGISGGEGVEKDAIMIGIIGCRFKRKMRMDWEDMLITKEQNYPKNGYGNNSGSVDVKRAWRQMWEEFYEITSYTYQEIASQTAGDQSAMSQYTERFVAVPKSNNIFDNEVYYKRMCIVFETVLLEAEYRAVEEGKYVFLNIVGAGLGVWRASHHQNDIFVLTCLERIHALLHSDRLNHVSDVNLAYIKPSSDVLAVFKSVSSAKCPKKAKIDRLFLENERHPKGGINVQLWDREPSAELSGEHAGKLLVMTYPWDGNAHPGNEFWIGKLSSSGDSAAAASTQISELHNAHINPNVAATNTRVAGPNGIHTLPYFCRSLS